MWQMRVPEKRRVRLRNPGTTIEGEHEDGD